ncbi:MAG: lanthionine synthetase C family protein [Sarcina sp.]
MSLYSGVTGFGMAIYLASRKKQKYEALLKSFNKIIIHHTKMLLKMITKDIDNLKESHYELIQGISGQLAYLLNFKEDPQIEEIIKEGLEYLINIIEPDETGVPKYLIKNKNIYKEGIIIKNQQKAIKDTLDFLKEFSYTEGQNVWWYGRVKKEDYLEKNKTAVKNRASWCYGTPGIGRAMYIAAVAIDDIEMKNFAIDALKGLAKINVKEYDLISPTICHGYAGILIVFDSMYKETNDIVFKEACNKLIDLIFEYYDKNFEFVFPDRNISFKNNFEILEKKSLGLLEGSLGVLLSLLSVINIEDMEWKRILLIN